MLGSPLYKLCLNCECNVIHRIFISDIIPNFSYQLPSLLIPPPYRPSVGQVAKTIKRARHIGMLPHIGEYVIQDSRPLHSENEIYHDRVSEREYVMTKTIVK